jgi:hypothetical protein
MSVELENEIKNHLIGKELTGIEFYTINDKYFVFDEDHLWVIDCGISLDFQDSSFSFGWNNEKGFYDHHLGKIENLAGEHKTKDLEAKNIEGINNLIGKKISDVNVKCNYYFDLDENYEPTEHKNFMPMEMIITFENEDTLQLAAIQFEVDKETRQMKNVIYDSEAEFLISLNKPVEITNESLE